MKKLITLIAVVLLSSTVVFAQSSNDKVQPPNGLSELEAYYLFYSDYQSENYQSALNNGRWILKALPREIEGYPKYDLPTQLDRFTTIYSEMAQKAADPSVKSAYIDSADAVFDKAFKTFSKDEIDYYQWYINRGRLYDDNSDFLDNGQAKAAAQYKKAFEINPEKMAQTADGYYVQVVLNHLVSEDTDEAKKEALAMIEKVEGDASEKLSSYFDKIQNKLYDSPEERMAYLEGKVEENPEDQETLRQLRDIYEDQDMMQKAQEINKKLYELDPSYQNTSALANFALQNANYEAAIKYLNEAKEKTEETEKLKTIYQNLAQAYLNQGNLRQARSNARQAIDADSDWGQPYITIANIYARAISECSSGRDLQRSDRAVYWLVIDYLNKAKSVDSSVSSAANNQLQSYRPVTPTKEDIFFMDNWKEGQSIRIDGSLSSCYSWINETTTVR